MAYTHPQHLPRELGLFGAVMMGLGSIVGTGIFVSIGIAAGAAGPAVLLAIVIAALVATCNGLSSAQLAANHPVSGGTYEYGYRYLTPSMGFAAGWMFLCAKSASAATAALGFAGYLLNLLHLSPVWRVPAALYILLFLTFTILSGMKRTNRVNIIIVSITLLALLAFCIAGLPMALRSGGSNLSSFFEPISGQHRRFFGSLFYASALMFVAYTGYGRIATLGEEVRDPKRTIPKAMIITLVVTMLLYCLVGAVTIGAIGAESFYDATQRQAAPLETAAKAFDVPGADWIVALGAVTAMAGVLLNLILGLSRVLLAMGRRGDMPRILAHVDSHHSTPTYSVAAVAVVIGLFTLTGRVETTWSFSAFTVLIYYALTNLTALRLPPQQRLYPQWIAAAGLVSCLSLAFFVEELIWMMGLGLLGIGLTGRWVLVGHPPKNP